MPALYCILYTETKQSVVVIVVLVAIVDIYMMVRVKKVDSHDDRQDKDTESEHDGSHSPALGLF